MKIYISFLILSLKKDMYIPSQITLNYYIWDQIKYDTQFVRLRSWFWIHGFGPMVLGLWFSHIPI